MLNMNFAMNNDTINSTLDQIALAYQDILDFAISEDFEAESEALAAMMADREKHSRRYINGSKKLKNGEVVGKKDFAFKTHDDKVADLKKRHHDKRERDGWGGGVYYLDNVIPLKGGKTMLGKDTVEIKDEDLWHPRNIRKAKLSKQFAVEDFSVTDSSTETEKDPLYEEFLNWKAKHEVEELKAENAELKATVEFLSNQYNSIRKELLAIKGE